MPVHNFMLQHSRIRLAHRLCTLCSRRTTATATSQSLNTDQNIEPPLKRHRDSLSVLRALASCVVPSAETPDFRLGGDPWLGSMPNMRNFLLAKAKGRLAARLAIRDYFPNDIVAVAKEVPRIDRWLPLQTPDSVLKRVSDGDLPASEAMDRLILLLAPVHAWKLYTDLAPDEPWTSELLHRLLDLLCATNSGSGGAHKHSILDGVDLTTLPDPEEMYFAEELAVQFDRTRERMALTLRDSRMKTGSQSVQRSKPAVQDKGEDLEEHSSSSSSDSESDTDDDVATEEHGSRRSTWLVQGPAEQLFVKAHDQLNTVAGYTSMIRGSAKFHNPQRAIELLEALRDLTRNDGPLEVSVYVSVLRSLHMLDNAREDVWSHIRRVLEQAIETGQEGRPVVALFEAALYALAETVIHRIEVGQPTGDYTAVGLGLLNELRQLGLEPSLGVMANLLRLIHFTQPDPNSVRHYACADLVDHFVSELDRRFQAHPPIRFDPGWSLDDFQFFPIAMRIASMENNVALGEKIDRLLCGTQDRRFFLATSWHRRNYVESYCLLQMNPAVVDREGKLGADADPVQLIRRVDKVYRTYWGTIVITNRIGIRFTEFLQRFFNTLIQMENHKSDAQHCSSTTVDQEAIRTARQLAYKSLCQFMSDLLDHTRLSTDADSSLTRSADRVIPMLATYADYDPTRAARLSAEVLKRFEQQAASRRPPAIVTTRLLEQLIRMTFPFLSRTIARDELRLDASDAEGSRRTELAQTVSLLHQWLEFASAHGSIGWSWTPEALHLLWKHNQLDELPTTLLTDVLRALNNQDCRPTSTDAIEARRIDLFMRPVLNAFEQVVLDEYASNSAAGLLDVGDSPMAIVSTERRQIISHLRDTLRNVVNDQSKALDSGLSGSAADESEPRRVRGIRTASGLKQN